MRSIGIHTAKLESIFTRHLRDLRNYLRKYLRSDADIDDCMQETLLKIWRQETEGNLRDDARAYLFTTALNTARDKKRRDVSRSADRHIALSEFTEPARNIRLEGETVVFYREALRLIEDSLVGLKPSTRRVFLLHHVDDMTTAEIALHLGISTRTVERELVRALDHCRAALGANFKDMFKGP